MHGRRGGRCGDKDADTQKPFVVIGRRDHTIHHGRKGCEPCEAGYHDQCYSAPYAKKFCICAKRNHQAEAQ